MHQAGDNEKRLVLVWVQKESIGQVTAMVIARIERVVIVFVIVAVTAPAAAAASAAIAAAVAFEVTVAATAA